MLVCVQKPDFVGVHNIILVIWTPLRLFIIIVLHMTLLNDLTRNESCGFISGLCAVANNGDRDSRKRETCQPTRRQFSTAALSLVGAAFFQYRPNIAFSEEENRLPNGARQFSQVVSAQRQWASVIEAFANGRVPDDAEWGNLRKYLRAVYAVSGDMDYLARRWEKSRRDAGLNTISDFRKAIKALDKPASRQNAKEFLEGHAKVAELFEGFFNTLKQDTVGDMPAEL